MSPAVAAVVTDLRARAAKLIECADLLESLDAPPVAVAPAPKPAVKRAKQKPPIVTKPPAAKVGVAPDKPAGPVGKVGDWTPSDDARMRELRAQGLTWKETAEKLGRTEGATIQRDLKLRRDADKAREAA